MEPVIVVWEHTRFGKLDALNLEDLFQQAGPEALDDASTHAAQVDMVSLGHVAACATIMERAK